MITFKAYVDKFDKKGEKTGWTYLIVPAEITEQINAGVKKSYRVKGKLAGVPIKQVALVPMGEGDFILPLNAEMRKNTGARKGSSITVQLEVDKSERTISADLLACLADEPKALEHFNNLPKGEQTYFSNWIESAKTEPTKTKRLAIAITAFQKGYRFGPMLRELMASKK